MKLTSILVAVAMAELALAQPSDLVRRQAYGAASTSGVASGPPPSAPVSVAIQTGIGAIMKARLDSTKAEAPAAGTEAPAGPPPLAAASGESSSESKSKKESKNAKETATGSDAAPATDAAKATATSTSPAAAASPAPAASDNIDLTVLNFALVAEQLESAFYIEASKKISVQQWQSLGISGAQAAFSRIGETLGLIAKDEATHIGAINGAINALGGKPVNSCSFDFGNALDDPLTFLSVARTLEAGGVGAYLGAAHLITDPSVLTAAGSILTVEARHQSLLSLFSGATPVPQAFDIAMSPPQVLALIGGFLVGCAPSDLGLVSNQALVAVDIKTQSSLFSVGSHLAFASSAIIEQQKAFCQMLIGGATNALVFPLQQCVVPEGISGPVAIFVTKDDNPLAGNIVNQDALSVIAGPAHAFVDSVDSASTQIFGSLLRIQQLASANLGLASLLKGGKNSVSVAIDGIGGFSFASTDIIIQQDVIIRASGSSQSFSRNSQHQWATNGGRRNKRHQKQRRAGHM